MGKNLGESPVLSRNRPFYFARSTDLQLSSILVHSVLIHGLFCFSTFSDEGGSRDEEAFIGFMSIAAFKYDSKTAAPELRFRGSRLQNKGGG